MDQQGFAREDGWAPGQASIPQKNKLTQVGNSPVNDEIVQILAKINETNEIKEKEVVSLLNARGVEFNTVCNRASELRDQVSGKEVTYVVNRNINYTNICYFRCDFCAFSKGKMSENLRGKPYDLQLDEIVRRTREAWDRDATEVCL